MSREMATSRESCDNVAGAVVRREVDMGSIGEDHEALKERVAELEQQLQTTHAQVAEVARLLDPEACPDAWGLHAAAQKVKARAEQAERERGEVVGWLAEVTVALTGERPHGAMPRTTLQAAMDATAARERAEADNAALLREMESVSEELARMSGAPLHHDIIRTKLEALACRVQVLWVKTNDHPGAALLERLRTLEDVREAANMAHACGKAECVQCNNLGAALAALDALGKTSCDECGVVGTHKLQCGRRG
jgi:hypothetical protein